MFVVYWSRAMNGTTQNPVRQNATPNTMPRRIRVRRHPCVRAPRTSRTGTNATTMITGTRWLRTVAASTSDVSTGRPSSVTIR